jgi:hypothetical protein
MWGNGGTERFIKGGPNAPKITRPSNIQSSSRWISESTPKDWFFSCNNEGWTSNAHAKKWLMEDFEPNTRDKANGRTRLLIFDGHGSHTTADIIRHCIINRIQLALLPPHSSHLTQPLDVGGGLRLPCSKQEPWD